MIGTFATKLKLFFLMLFWVMVPEQTGTEVFQQQPGTDAPVLPARRSQGVEGRLVMWERLPHRS